MKESKFLGALLPSSPDFAPIIQAVREKYYLRPDGFYQGAKQSGFYDSETT